MKVRHLLLLVALFVFSKCTTRVDKSAIPTLPLSDLSRIDTEVSIRNWRLLGPFLLDSSAPKPIDIDNLKQWNIEENSANEENIALLDTGNIKTATKEDTCRIFDYHSEKYHVDLSKVLSTEHAANCYAAAVINSTNDQDCALFLGNDDGVKVWVNNKLYLKLEGRKYLERNANIFSIHLNKGRNFLFLKINNIIGRWGFYATLSSVKYAKDYYISLFGPDFLENCLLSRNDSLHVKINPLFIPNTGSSEIEILNVAREKVLALKVAAGSEWKLPLNIKEGAYVCRLKADHDTIEQKFVVGNYKMLYGQLEKALKGRSPETKFKINTETLFTRYEYLDSFGIRNGYERSLKRKISMSLFELSSVLENSVEKRNPFADKTGLHLRGYRSKIDNSIEYYMVYIPSSYRKEKPIPLVTIMPWVSTPVPFIQSPHVSYLNKIDIAERLAEKYGYALLWPGSRIFERYNLNPITAISTFEALSEISKDYNIDEKRTYAFGSCSGGLFALLMANRYPSCFAAVGVEGPELSYIKTNFPVKLPSQWVEENNILNLPENYEHIPLYISHSVDDKKADFYESDELARRVRKAGGEVVFDTLKDVAKSNYLDLYPEEEIIDKIFTFFKSKESRTYDTVEFSTTQLKYNHAYWISIDKLEQLHKKATIKATVGPGKSIAISETNVRQCTINLSCFPWAKKGENINIELNGNTLCYNIPDKREITISADKTPNRYRLIKSHNCEGPINDLFREDFIVVQGTEGSLSDKSSNKAIVDTFIANWKQNYFSSCRIKKDIEITRSELKNSNLLVIGNQNQNALLKLLHDSLPIQIGKDAITLRGHKFIGDKLGYSLIYPNPYNPDKYIVLIGSNNADHPNIYLNLPYEGWFDYEIKDLSTGTSLSKGYFDENWK